MKIALINHSDIKGGASRAAYRIHHSLRRCGVDSTMLVNQAVARDWTVSGPLSKWSRSVGMARAPLGELLNLTLRTSNPVLHSPAILPSNWSARLNSSDTELLHLHWINGEMLSITDIGRIRKPVVWTLHDMWAFCGAEHYTEEFRWREGYRLSNRPSYESGFDLNRWTWARKRKYWTRHMQIVTPSSWLAECARQSVLMRDWPVSVIPNAIDTDVWQPVDKQLARQLLQLPQDAPLLLFGALGGASDPRKGFDLLTGALNQLRGEVHNLELVIFGQLAPRTSLDLGFPIHYAGHMHDDISLRLLYSAADAMVVPSRIESFGQTASEAHACGTPVVAFRTSGLTDIVSHKKSGWLAKPFDIMDLADGLKWVLGNANRDSTLSRSSREIALSKFSYSVVANKYIELYKSILNADQ